MLRHGLFCNLKASNTTVHEQTCTVSVSVAIVSIVRNAEKIQHCSFTAQAK